MKDLPRGSTFSRPAASHMATQGSRSHIRASGDPKPYHAGAMFTPTSPPPSPVGHRPAVCPNGGHHSHCSLSLTSRDDGGFSCASKNVHQPTPESPAECDLRVPQAPTTCIHRHSSCALGQPQAPSKPTPTTWSKTVLCHTAQRAGGEALRTASIAEAPNSRTQESHVADCSTRVISCQARPGGLLL